MSKQDYILGMREPSGGDKVRDDTITKMKSIPFW